MVISQQGKTLRISSNYHFISLVNSREKLFDNVVFNLIDSVFNLSDSKMNSKRNTTIGGL